MIFEYNLYNEITVVRRDVMDVVLSVRSKMRDKLESRL